MCKTCENFDVFLCDFCTHWVSLTPEGVRHHEDTVHPQLVMARLRAQLRMAQDLQRATLSIVERLRASLTSVEEQLAQQVTEMEKINQVDTSVSEE